MKFVYMQKGRFFLIICLCLAMLGMAALYIAGVLKSTEYTGVFTPADGQSKYEVKSRILQEAIGFVGVCEPKQAAEVWAEGVKKRNAGMQYAVMCESLKKEYAKSLESNAPYWVTGVSSPWVERYTVEDISPLDSLYIARVRFTMATSDGAAGEYKAQLTIVREKDFFCISKITQDEGLKAYTGM